MLWLWLCLVCFPKLRLVYLCLCGCFGRNAVFNPFPLHLSNKNNIFFVVRAGERSLKAASEGHELCAGSKSHVDIFFPSKLWGAGLLLIPFSEEPWKGLE